MVYNSIITMEKYKAMKRKFTALIIISAFLASLLTYSIAVIANPSSSDDTVIERYGMTEEASWIIFKIGNVYKAKNGTTGEIRFSSTNASSVINNVFDELELVSGGRVLLKAGTYVIYNTLYISRNVVLEGESFETILQRGAENISIIRNKNIARNPSLGYTDDGIIIRNLKIDGNNIGADEWRDVINLGHTSRFTIESLLIENAPGRNDAIDLDGCKDGKIRNVRFRNVGGAAVHLSGAFSDWTERSACQYITVEDCYADNVGDARQVAAYNIWSDSTSIQGDIYNVFRDCIVVNSYAGFAIDNEHPDSGHNKIVNPIVANVDTRGIILQEQGRNAVFGGRVLYAGTYGIWVQSHSNVISGVYVKGTQTYDGIVLYQAQYNVVQSSVFLNNERDGIRLNNVQKTTILGCLAYDDGAGIQDYGIREVPGSGANFNRIHSCNTFDNSMAGIFTTGSHSKVTVSWNNTIWAYYE